MALLILVFVVACATMRQSAEPAGSVARIWHGGVPDARAEYYAYLKSAGIAKLEQIPGNLGADVLTRSRNGVTDFIVISYWRSLDDIKAYAGADVERTHRCRGFLKRRGAVCCTTLLLSSTNEHLQRRFGFRFF